MPRSLFVLHGALGSAHQMAPVGEALADAFSAHQPSLAVRVVELPGHGRTPLAGDAFQMSAFTEALARAVADDTAHHEAPIIFGYSMGGYVALLLEATAPGTFAGIVTLGTMIDWTPVVATGAAARLDPVVMRAKVPAFAAHLDALHEAVGGADAMLARTAGLLRTLGEAPPLTPERLASIRCPVSFLVGERDDSVDFAHTQTVAASMAHGTATRLPGLPHPIEKVPASVITDAVRSLLTASARP